jgi:serine phosphatase RsbU (regulator of sigma subunit)
MSRPAVHKKETIEWGVAAEPIAGETVSGDLYVVKPFDHGVLLAAIDGVGHGPEATAAARIAAAILENHAHESVISLVERCHEALVKTRGVVMTLASLNALENSLTWFGVGNVKGLLLRADANAIHLSERVLLRSGLVGFKLPALHASVIPVTPGDLLIFATDGIRIDFAGDVNLNEAPTQMAARILHGHSKGTDDALVLAARYLGARHE